VLSCLPLVRVVFLLFAFCILLVRGYLSGSFIVEGMTVMIADCSGCRLCFVEALLLLFFGGSRSLHNRLFLLSWNRPYRFWCGVCIFLPVCGPFPNGNIRCSAFGTTSDIAQLLVSYVYPRWSDVFWCFFIPSWVYL
jgi:hypothetical protein